MDSIVERCTTATDCSEPCYNVLPVWLRTPMSNRMSPLYAVIKTLLTHETDTTNAIHITVFSDSVPFLYTLLSNVESSMDTNKKGHTQLWHKQNSLSIELFTRCPARANTLLSPKKLYIYDITLCTSLANWCHIFHTLADLDTTCIFVGLSCSLTPSFTEYIHTYNMPILYGP